jgi:hypothetical protein
MPNPRKHIKLHLNEHLSPRLAQQLRKHGFDVTSTLESDLVSKSDAEQLEYCCVTQRAILTFNKDHFSHLHAEYADKTESIGASYFRRANQLVFYCIGCYVF